MSSAFIAGAIVAGALTTVGVVTLRKKFNRAYHMWSEYYTRIPHVVKRIEWLDSHAPGDFDIAEAILAYAYEGGTRPDIPLDRLPKFEKSLESADEIRGMVDWISLPLWKIIWRA